jgi:hypothetical protein
MGGTITTLSTYEQHKKSAKYLYKLYAKYLYKSYAKYYIKVVDNK